MDYGGLALIINVVEDRGRQAKSDKLSWDRLTGGGRPGENAASLNDRCFCHLPSAESGAEEKLPRNQLS